MGLPKVPHPEARGALLPDGPLRPDIKKSYFHFLHETRNIYGLCWVQRTSRGTIESFAGVNSFSSSLGRESSTEPHWKPGHACYQ